MCAIVQKIKKYSRLLLQVFAELQYYCIVCEFCSFKNTLFCMESQILKAVKYRSFMVHHV